MTSGLRCPARFEQLSATTNADIISEAALAA
jgi:hypothetical protein